MDLEEIGYWDVDWIHMLQYKDRWWAGFNIVMSLGVS
jgi:hypothetical protein